MIVCELLHDKGILLITPEGPLEASDFHRWLRWSTRISPKRERSRDL